MVHDVLDPKFGSSSEAELDLRNALEDENFSDMEKDSIVLIAKSVGYKNILHPDFNERLKSLPFEYRFVQDADLLDAIGAIGVARCFTFGGKRSRDMFGLGKSNEYVTKDVSFEEYASRQGSIESVAAEGIAEPSPSISLKNSGGSGVEHFFEKLLKIKKVMLTARGAEMASARQEFMLSFLDSLNDELTEAGVVETHGKLHRLI